MSYLDRIHSCHNACFDHILPWLIGDIRYGWVHQNFANHLRNYPAVFSVEKTAVYLNPELSGYDERSVAVNEVMYQLHQAGVIDTWVGEAYPVTLAFEQPAVMEIERAVASFMGTRSFGVHVNGLVKKSDGIGVWIGTRTRAKPFWPGKLDQMVAGGQPVGIGLLDNVVKEAEEEAGIPEDLARQAQLVGRIAYQNQGRRGLEDSTLFVYDMWLPDDFEPVNTDGEVEGFQLMSLIELAELTETSEDFKDNCNLVNIDLLLRQGVIDERHADYAAIRQLLY